MSGSVKLMVTQGGNHPPETTAMACAQLIVSCAPDVSSENLFAVSELQIEVAKALMPHHTDAGSEIEQKLATDPAHFENVSHDPGSRLDEAFDAVAAVFAGTKWEPMFADHKDKIRQVIGQYLVDIAHTARLWHAHKNPDDTGAKAYRDRYIPPARLVGA